MDWHTTQNDLYLGLLRERLDSPILTWVSQFVDIINRELLAGTYKTHISINDFGCNVRHFFRALEQIQADITYRGYDISETYLAIARERFGDGFFSNVDISDSASAIQVKKKHSGGHVGNTGAYSRF